VSSQSFEFSCSLASLAAHAVAQPRYLRSVSCRCRVAVELVSLVSRHDMGGRCVGEVAGLQHSSITAARSATDAARHHHHPPTRAPFHAPLGEQPHRISRLRVWA
jgi:hypothetical protein